MADTKMNYTLKDRLLQFTTLLQRELFAWPEAEERALTSKHQEVIRILEFACRAHTLRGILDCTRLLLNRISTKQEIMMEIITLADFQNDCATILETVNRNNQAILISHQGVPLVKILPATPHTWLGSMKNTGQIIGNIVTPLDPTSSEWQVFE